MTDHPPPMRMAPSSLVVARRALVAAMAALVAAVVALVIAINDGSDSEPAPVVDPDRAQTDAAAARVDADLAVAKAEEAAAMAMAAEEAFAAALAVADGGVSSDVIARLEAQLEEARAEASVALAMANAAAAAEEAPAPESEDVVEPEEGSESEEEPESGEGDEPEEGSEPEDTGPPADLPGEPFELGPSGGAGLAVVGIRAGSALNVRDAPNGEVIARLDNVMDGVRDPAVYVRRPDTDDIVATVDLHHGVVATGSTRRLTTTVWHEFRADELTGWSSAAYLAQAGVTDDATSEVVEVLGGLPSADTMLELGMAVARTVASQEPQSRVVVSEAPGVSGDLAQMTIDVIDIGDDSVLGFRLVVFAVPASEAQEQADTDPFTLKSVERTVLCHSHRGVSEEGLCL